MEIQFCGSIVMLAAMPAAAACFILRGFRAEGPVGRGQVRIGLAMLASAVAAVFLTPLAWLPTGYSGSYTAALSWPAASAVAMGAAFVMIIRLRRGRWMAGVVGLAFPLTLWAGVELGIAFVNAVAPWLGRKW
jgi:hypothetical protein